MSPPSLRVARPVTQLELATRMYCDGLDFRVLGSFRDHEGFDGVMLGYPGAAYHFELVHAPSHAVVPTPTVEDLLVFYLPDERVWEKRCRAMLEAGFHETEPFNPYWSVRGRTFVDPDGYRTVLERAPWPPAQPGS